MLEPKSSGTFAQLHRARPDAPEYLEFIKIGQFTADCPILDNAEVRQDFSEALNKLVEDFFPQLFSGLRVISEGRTQIGKYDAYEIRLQGSKEYEGKGRITTWARVVIVPGVKRIDEEVPGVTLVMKATSLTPEVKGVADVGLKGELPVILNSFRFNPAEVDNRLGPPDTRVTKVMTGTGLKEVDGKNDIVNPTDEFTTKSEITFLWQAKNVRKGTLFREVVVTEDRPGVGDTSVLTYQENFPEETDDDPCGVTRTRTRVVKPGEKGWAPGKYRFEIYQDGKLIKSVPFRVKD